MCASHPTIKIVGTFSAVYRNILKRILEYNNIKFELINIEDIKESDLNVEFKVLNNIGNIKNIAFPSIVLDNDIVVGYNIEKLEKLLNRKLLKPPVAEKSSVDMPKDDADKNELMEYYNTIKLFSEYNGYYLNPDKDYVFNVLNAQLKHQENGIKYCPCKLGNVPCPCAGVEQEIKTYGHCFCGLYVSKEYIKNWKKMDTPLMLSNRNIKKYNEIPNNIDSHFLKIHILFNGMIDESSKSSDFIEELLDKSYRLKNSGYGIKNDILIKFKEDEAHKNLQLWYNDFDDYYNNKNKVGDIFSDYEFDIAINTPIKIPDGKKIKFEGLTITTNYKNTQYRRRYLIEGNNLNNSNIINGIDCIIVLEVVEQMNETMNNLYMEYSKKIELLQQDINQLVMDVNINKEHSFEEYLSMLSISVKNISNLQEGLTKKYSLFEYYMAKRLGNQKFKSFLDSAGYTVDYEELLNDFTHLLNELSIMKNTINELIGILETNVNISQNNKTINLQNEIHKTAKTQLNMHRAVEGLYTIFAAFYFTELALIIFEGLNHAGVVKYNAYVLASFFVPVAMFLGIVVSKKLKNRYG
jgi:ferredoxin-thioredoxin reductase catalytic subunit/glutaredoxin